MLTSQIRRRWRAVLRVDIAASVARQRTAPVERLRVSGAAGAELAQRPAGGNSFVRVMTDIRLARLQMRASRSS
jgi:hypothetical protein